MQRDYFLCPPQLKTYTTYLASKNITLREGLISGVSIFLPLIFLILQNLCKCRITVHKVQSGGGEIFRSEKIMVLIWLLLWLTTQQFTVLQPATTHLLPNKSFVSMIKMSNPVLLTMLVAYLSIPKILREAFQKKNLPLHLI